MRNTPMSIAKAIFSVLLITTAIIFSPRTLAQAPTITSFTPVTANIGGSVVITGTNFNTTASNNVVYFNGMKGAVTAASATSLTVTVPSGAQYGPISVTTGSKTAYSTQLFNPTFPCGTTLSTSTFTTPAFTMTTGNTPEGSCAGDLDGDGKMDLVVASNAGNIVSIFRNIASPGSLTAGSFASRVDLPTIASGNLFQVNVGDLNGDGKLDIVVTGFTSNSVYIYENNSTSGNISFQTVQTLTLPGSGCGVQVADMDADGLPEIIVANRSRYTSIFKNANTGGAISSSDFTRTDYTFGATTAQNNDVQVADMNLDGKPDLVVPELSTAVIHVLINNSALTFTTQNITSTTTNMWGVTLADMDGDGMPDITGHYRFGNQLFCFRNTSSSGTFSVASEVNVVTSGATLLFATAADLNGDGKPEFIGANLTANNSYIVPNNSTSGSLSFGTPIALGSGGTAINVIAADFDGDKLPDIFYPDNSTAIRGIRNKSNIDIVLTTTTNVVCKGASAASVGYTATSSPTTYTIVWDAAALTAGFTNVPSTALPASPLSVAVPGSAAAGTYNGTITVSNGTCTSFGTPISIKIQDPTITLGTSPSVLAGSTSANLPYTATTGAITTYSITYNAAANTAGFSNVPATALPSSPITLAVPAAAAPGVYNGTITVTDGTCTSPGVAFTVTLINPNTTPSFVSSTPQTLSVCQDASATDIKGLLHVSDADASQTETWSQQSAPSHGALSFSSATASSGSTNITPGGTITYTPTAGYSGADAFTVKVDDGNGGSSNMVVNVTVNPKPSVTNSNTASTCSGTGPNISLTASVPSNFAWTLGTNTGAITGPANGSGSSLNQTLTNPSNTTAGSIVYIVTPTSTTGSCVGAASNITVTVNPAPAVTNSNTASTCSGVGPNISLTASVASSFAWSIGTNIGSLSGASAASGSTINQALTNPSNTTAGSLVYIVTPTSTANSCIGAPFNITVTVNPAPSVTNSNTASTCSGTGPNISLTSSIASNFAWTLGTNTGAITGASASSGSTINQTLTNPSNSTAGSIVYIVTPTSTSNSCVGAATNVTVTVNPTPQVTNSATASTCSGTGPNIGLTASAASNFAWTLGTNTGAITGASAASGSTINQTLTNPSNATAGSIVYIVTPTSTTGSCVGATYNITVTVNPIPAITTANTASTCSGTSPNITLAATAPSNFAWTLGTNTGAITGAANGSGSNLNQTLTNPSNTTAGSIVYIVTPTSTSGSCVGAASNITVTVNPAPAVTNANTASTCSGVGPNISLTSSVASNFAWTIGTNIGSLSGASAASGSTINQALTNPSNSTAGSLVYIVTPTSTANSCIGAPYNITVTVNPIPAVTNASAAAICSGTSPNIGLTASAPSSFAWTLGTNTGAITGASAASGATINQTLTNPSNATAGSIVYIVTPTSTTGSCVGATSNITVTVNPIPAVTTANTAATCSGTSPNVALTASAASNFAWTLGTNTGAITGASAASGATINQTLTNPSNSTAGSIVYIVTPTSTGGSCVGAPSNITVTVNPIPAVTTANTAATCSGTSPNIALTASAASTFAWTLGTNTGAITGASASSGSTLNQVLTNPSNATAGSIVYAVTPTSTTGSCVGAPTNITVTVNPKPVVMNASTAAICSGTGPNIGLTASAPSSFAWTLGTNTGAITGASASSGATINQTLTNPSNAIAGSIVYIVTPTATTGSCVGTASNITVTVNPIPAVTTATTASTCNATSPNVALTASAASTFAWTLGTNTGSIGGASASSGSTINQTLTNPSNATPGSIVYIVTPTSTGGLCVGSPTNITVTVNPTPAVTNATTASTCSGTTPNLTLTASAASTFTWTLGTNTGAITGALAGSGGSINQVLTNPSNNTNGSIVYAVTPTSTGGLCVGSPTNITITVNPKPTLGNVTRSVCHNVTTTMALAPSIASTFTWTVTTPGSITGGTSGTNQANFTQTLSNPSASTPANTVYTVTPTATLLGSCVGNPTQVTVTVNPIPDVNTIANQVVCNGTPVTAVVYSGVVPGTTYAWTNNVTSIGLAASGSGNINAFNGINTGTGIVTATVSVTPSFAGCVGTPKSFTIRVNPTPNMTIPANQVLCHGINTAAVTFTGTVTGTTFAWTNNTPTMGLAASGTGNIPAFTASNITANPVTGTISITPTANSCNGLVRSFTIRVNPLPVLSSPLIAPSMCDSTQFTYVPTSATTGTSFAWNRTAVAGIANAGTSGINAPGEYLDNTTNDTVNVNYTFTMNANACTFAQNVMVTVNPTPRLTSVLSDTVCSGDMFSYKPTSLTPAATFTWNRATVSGILPPGASGTGDINEVLQSSNTSGTNVVYTVSTIRNGCSTTDNVNLLVNPTPQPGVISIKTPNVLCWKTMYQNFGAATPPPSGAIYRWTAVDAQVWATGANTQNAIISFPSVTTAVIHLTTVVPGTGCHSETTYSVIVKADSSVMPQVAYYNNRFVCLQNNATEYRWGYDDKVTLDSTIIANQTGQDYWIAAPDFTKYYYWVMTTKDGCWQKAYFNKPADVTPVAEVKEYRIKAYPNPANDMINVELDMAANNADLEFRVYDMAGRLVMKAPGTAGRTTQLNVSPFAPGFYMISCIENGTQVAFTKFIKQ